MGISCSKQVMWTSLDEKYILLPTRGDTDEAYALSQQSSLL